MSDLAARVGGVAGQALVGGAQARVAGVAAQALTVRPGARVAGVAAQALTVRPGARVAGVAAQALTVRPGARVGGIAAQALINQASVARVGGVAGQALTARPGARVGGVAAQMLLRERPPLAEQPLLRVRRADEWVMPLPVIVAPNQTEWTFGVTDDPELKLVDVDSGNTVSIGNGGGGSGASSLDDLDDVDASDPSDGDALVWNEGESQWEPGEVDNGNGVASRYVPVANGDPSDPSYLFAPDGSGLFVEVDW